MAGVLRRGARALLGLRPAGKRHGGCWEFPGGKLGAAETEGAAMARELREELGVALVRMEEHRFSARDPGSPFVVHFWDVAFTGEPAPREHEELRWVTREEALQLPLAPSDRRFVEEGW